MLGSTSSLARRVTLGVVAAAVFGAGTAASVVEAAAYDTPRAAAPVCSSYARRDALPLKLCDASFFVAAVQVQLAWALPNAGIVIDGRFGPKTAAATGEFQRRYQLPATGVVNPATWAKLVEASALCGAFHTNNALPLRKCDQGVGVAWVQYRLNELVHVLPPINVGGHFGPQTDRAVREFQAGHGLTIDGIVGRQTLSALLTAQA